MYIGRRKEFLKLTSLALVLKNSEMLMIVKSKPR